MSSLAVKDIDCIVSMSPLRLDHTSRKVTGAAALLRRALYRWFTLKGTRRHAPGIGLVIPLLSCEGQTFDKAGLSGLKVALLREATDVDFVAAANVSLTLTPAGRLLVEAEITLVDGRTYPLEVSVGAASAAIIALGGT